MKGVVPLKETVKHLIAPALCILAASIYFAQTSAVLQAELDICDARYQLQQARLLEVVIELDRQQDQLDRLIGQLEQVEPNAAAIQLRDIPLSDDLQLHTYRIGQQYGVPPDVLFAIMEHESRFQPQAVGYNTDGSYDSGLCQINSVNIDWLQADYGLDITDPRDNIESAAVILSGYLERYHMDQALAAYAAGESGMRDGDGAWFAEEILKALQKPKL